MDMGTSILAHVNYSKTLSDNLEAVGDVVAEEDLVIILISSLPQEYNYLITALETIAEDKPTWDYVSETRANNLSIEPNRMFTFAR